MRKIKAWWDLTTKEDWVIAFVSSILFFVFSYFMMNNNLLFSIGFPVGFMLRAMVVMPIRRHNKMKRDK